MTYEEVFVKVRDHLLKQNAKSMGVYERGATEGCTYRGEDGASCAVGCLIDDEHYSEKLEGRSVKCGDVVSALERSGVPMDFEFVELLGQLQRIHDDSPSGDWDSDLKNLARVKGFRV